MREMKESNISWLGNIPANWNIEKVYCGFTRKKSKANQDDPVVLSLARDGVKVRDISTNEGQLAADYSNYNPVDIDDLLLNPMDLYSGDNCNISKVKGVISPAYINLRAKEGYHPEFYNYYFKVQYWTMAFHAHGKGVDEKRRWTLGDDEIHNYPLLHPSYEEQIKIANYLNDKCSKVDEAISRNNQIIEKLEEYRKAIIVLAIKKYSKTEIKAKYLFNIYPGATPSTKIPSNWDGNIPWITPADFKTEDKYVSGGMRFLTEEGYNEASTVLVPKGSLIVSKRAPIGTVAIASNELCTNQGCLSLVPNKDVNFELYYYVFSVLTEKMEQLASGTTFKEISLMAFNNMKIPLFEEQNEALSYISKQDFNIQESIKRQNTIVSKLEEYKKSLIYNAVTGKIEV